MFCDNLRNLRIICIENKLNMLLLVLPKGLQSPLVFSGLQSGDSVISSSRSDHMYNVPAVDREKCERR